MNRPVPFVTAPFVIALVAALLLAALPARALPAAPCPTVPGEDDKCETWSAAYNYAGGRGGMGEDIGRAIAVAADGRVFVAGLSKDDASYYDAVVAAFDKNGNALWNARYSGPSTYDTYSDIAVDATGTRVFATGRSAAADETFDWATSAYDAATGATLWTVRLAGDTEELGPTYDIAWTVDTSPDGQTVYVGGTFEHDYLLVAYDVADGNVRWSARYDGPAHDYDSIRELEVAGDGRVFVTGESDGTGTSHDAATIAYSAEGEPLWVARFDGGQRIGELGEHLALSRDGARVAVQAHRWVGPSVTSNNDIVTVAYDATSGEELWAQTYQGPGGASDGPAGVEFSPDGQTVYAAGTSREAYPMLGQFLAVAYDAASGQQRWQSSYGTPYNDQALGLAVSADGTRIVLTGYWVFPKGEIMPVFRIEPRHSLTVAFDPTGRRVWTARHDASGIGADVAVDIAAAPTGKRVHTVGTFVFTGYGVYVTDKAGGYSYDVGTLTYDG